MWPLAAELGPVIGSWAYFLEPVLYAGMDALPSIDVEAPASTWYALFYWLQWEAGLFWIEEEWMERRDGRKGEGKGREEGREIVFGMQNKWKNNENIYTKFCFDAESVLSFLKNKCKL